MRSEIRSREKSSVSDEATHSTNGRVRTRFRYSFPIKRVAGKTSCAPITRSRSSPVASASLIQRRIPPLRVLVSVMIDNAFPPARAETPDRRARKNDRVFDRNDRLVVIAVQRPGLQLPAAEFAFVHQQMKGMLVVIALFADLAQRRTQLLERKLGRVARGFPELQFQLANCPPPLPSRLLARRDVPDSPRSESDSCC